MPDSVVDILAKDSFDREDLIQLLSAEKEEDKKLIFAKAEEVRELSVGNIIYLRGLIEYSNICRKNCFYCGIRAGNPEVERFSLDEKQVIECARHAYEQNYGSVVIQSGERTGKDFTEKITNLLMEIKKLSNGELGITLSCGEQSRETYQQWFEAGAHRYLLRFESADQELYYKIHPEDSKHNFTNRMIALKNLREIGYQVGSGMMIGLPGQAVQNLVDDLMLLKQLDVDMVGMGPYIEHTETPLYLYRDQLMSQQDRLDLTLSTIAVLRIYMKDINIASSTALDSLDANGREMAIKAGANVLMPNLTPVHYRENYFLYENKPYLTEADELIEKINKSKRLNGFTIGWNSWGDSKHFTDKKEVIQS